MVERVELPAKSRRPRQFPPRYIILHSTQGATDITRQYSATKNWMKAGGAEGLGGSWGPSCDIVIGHDGREAWFTLGGKDFHETRANWSAGYGANSNTTYGADEYGIAIELAQTDKGEKPTPATLLAAVARCAALCREFNIDPVRIDYLAQLRGVFVPSGIVGHEDTENGRKTGKWDPNKTTFPWSGFIAEIRAQLQEEDEPMSNAYIVAPLDNLSKISARLGISVAELVRINRIPDADRIEVGQVLRLADDAPMPAGMVNVNAAKVHLTVVRQSVDRAWTVLDGGSA